MPEPTLDEWMDDDVPDLMHDATGEHVPMPHFAVDSLHKLNWALRKIGAMTVRVEDRNAQADAWIARVEEWRDHANRGDLAAIGRLEGLCKAYHEDQLVEAMAEGLPESQWPKTITAPHGVLTSSAGRDRVVVDDEAAVVAWAHASAVEVWAEPKLLTSKLREHTAVKDENGRRVLVFMGEVVPGVRVEKGERTFKVKPVRQDNTSAEASTHRTRVVFVQQQPHNYEAECSCGWVSAGTMTHDQAWRLAMQHEGTPVEVDTAAADHAETQALDDPIRAEADADRDAESRGDDG